MKAILPIYDSTGHFIGNVFVNKPLKNEKTGMVFHGTGECSICLTGGDPELIHQLEKALIHDSIFR